MREKIVVLLALSALVCGALWTSSGVVRAADPTRYVSLSGTDNATCDKNHPCLHVQHAVDVATPGDKIILSSGTYVEQVTITKSLTVRGDGVDNSVIKAPDTKILDAHFNTYIVEVSGAVTLDMSQLTVKGPGGPGGGLNCGPNPLSLDKGISVIGGATLNLSEAAVRDIYDQPVSGCQRGDGISIGSACFSCTPDVGHATIDDVLVNLYQKNGVAVRGAGSTLTLENNQIINQPSSVIASNGIEVLSGAVGIVRRNKVTGNECNLTPACGPDPVHNDQGSGILVSVAATSTTVEKNQVSGNDVGIYTNTGVVISHNTDSNNRYEDLLVDMTTSGAQVLHNVTNGSNYGIYVTSGNAGGNNFAHDSGHSNTIYDFYWGGGNASTFSHNSCNTAFPSKAFWDCQGGTSGDNSGDGNGGNDNGGNDNGD